MDDDLYSRPYRHIPIWSTDRLVGWFHDNRALCRVCHPQGCPATDCHGFSRNDVTEGHVGRSCGQCGEALPGSEAPAT